MPGLVHALEAGEIRPHIHAACAIHQTLDVEKHLEKHASEVERFLLEHIVTWHTFPKLKKLVHEELVYRLCAFWFRSVANPPHLHIHELPPDGGVQVEVLKCDGENTA